MGEVLVNIQPLYQPVKMPGEMAVAFFMGHALRAHTIVPLQNKGELAALYCFVFLYLAAAGIPSLLFTTPQIHSLMAVGRQNLVLRINVAWLAATAISASVLG